MKVFLFSLAFLVAYFLLFRLIKKDIDGYVAKGGPNVKIEDRFYDNIFASILAFFDKFLTSTQEQATKWNQR